MLSRALTSCVSLDTLELVCKSPTYQVSNLLLKCDPFSPTPFSKNFNRLPLKEFDALAVHEAKIVCASTQL